MMEEFLVPLQQQGSELDIQAVSEFATEQEAIAFFELVKLRLQDVNNWDIVCGTAATTFKLTLPDGSPSFRLAIGNLIKIDIPGPGTITGEGYDWVRVEEIAESKDAEDEQWFGFRVRPCPNPANGDESVAHFFSEVATSTFIIRRQQHKVMAEMHGRNETPNASNDKIVDGIRNVIVGWTAKMGLSYPQWKLLVEGLVKNES
ncbi:MAG: hypothetical protein EOO42_06840 [Flavobacteriales bacterium]|nr:MAG: hypothetical protein EOO42_06840 [Flavobacteriales bacterium]